MRRLCGSITLGTCWLLLLAGCRTPQPDLKPPKQPESLASPPQDARYNQPGFPKEAFNTNDDPTKRNITKDNAILPTRGSGPGLGNGIR